MAPIASEGMPSARGFHVAPASQLSQIPPPAAPHRTWREFLGSSAMLDTRPLTSTRAVPYVRPLGITDGPSGSQLLVRRPPARVDLDRRCDGDAAARTVAAASRRT